MNIKSLSFGMAVNTANQKNQRVVNNLKSLQQDTISFEGKTDRTPLVAGNWKMNQTSAQASSFMDKFAALVKKMPEAKGNLPQPQVLIAPPFTTINTLVDKVKENGLSGLVKVGAQNCHYESNGAYTGEISIDMLKEAGVKHVIIGHSERREFNNETDATVNLKTKEALAKDMVPIVCFGETEAEYEDGKTKNRVTTQVTKALEGIAKEDVSKVVLAYEPVWAIGTGKTCKADRAEEICKFTRDLVEKLYDFETADSVRILYGGSMKPGNIVELVSQEDIDGGLIGGAALEADSLAQMYEKASNIVV